MVIHQCLYPAIILKEICWPRVRVSSVPITLPPKHDSIVPKPPKQEGGVCHSPARSLSSQYTQRMQSGALPTQAPARGPSAEPLPHDLEHSQQPPTHRVDGEGEGSTPILPGPTQMTPAP